MQTRRDLLRLGLLAIAVFPFARDRPEPDVAERVSALFRRPERAQSVGARYLVSQPGAQSATRELGATIRARPPGDTAALRAFLRARTREDFRTERIVLLDGWILAETEAQACALTLGS